VRGEVLQDADAELNFSVRLGNQLAHFHGDAFRELVGALTHQDGHFGHQSGSFSYGNMSPLVLEAVVYGVEG
jgi:hypothetical protein